MNIRIFLITFVAGLVCAQALAATPAADAGPWAKVPPLTTACFYGADPFRAKLDAALAAVMAGRDNQLAVNQKIEEEYKSIDPMEKASRMQQWMLDNPQEATKYLQGVQAIGDDFNAQMPAMNAAQQRFKDEESALIKRYHAALDTAYAPGYARFSALKTKLGVDQSYPSVKDSGSPDWAMVEENVIMRDLDKAYAATCPQWWSDTSPTHAWLKAYRDWITKEYIPFYNRISSQNAQSYAIMGTPSASWKAVSDYDGVIMYLKAVSRVFGERREKPRCDATDCGYM